MPAANRTSFQHAASPRTRARYLPPLVLLLCVLAVYARTITADFVLWDDFLLIVQNKMINPPTWAGLPQIWAHPHIGMFIPVTYSLWLALASISMTDAPDYLGVAANPFVFHLANLAMQTLCAWLAYRILHLLLSRIRGAQAWTAPCSLAGAVLWAIHPLQVEPVAWVTGMKDLLSGALALAGILIYLNRANTGGKWLSLDAPPLLLFFASLAKPGVVGVPVICAVLDIVIFQRPLRQVFAASLPILLATLPAMIWTHQLQPPFSPEHLTPLWLRPLIAGHAVAFYLVKLAWPDKLAIDYGQSPQTVLQSGAAWVAWLLPVAITIAILCYRRARRILLAAWLIMLIAVGPVLGLVPFSFQVCSTVADRYMHLALLGPAMAFAWMLTLMPRRAAVCVAVSICAALGVRSFVQTGVWKDSTALADNCVAVQPTSLAGLHVRAADLWSRCDSLRYLAKRMPEEPRRLTLQKAYDLESDGIACARQALAARPTYLITADMLIARMAGRGETDALLEVIEQACDKADALPPNYDWNRDPRERLLACQRCFQTGAHLDWVIRNLHKYLVRHPNDADALAMLQQLQ